MRQAIDLTKHYPTGAGRTANRPASDQLNLTGQPGEIFCLLRQNGAGKTTTINLFLGFLQPTLGQAIINGLNVVQHPQETRKFLAYLPETVMLYPNLTGVENPAPTQTRLRHTRRTCCWDWISRVRRF